MHFFPYFIVLFLATDILYLTIFLDQVIAKKQLRVRSFGQNPNPEFESKNRSEKSMMQILFWIRPKERTLNYKKNELGALKYDTVSSLIVPCLFQVNLFRLFFSPVPALLFPAVGGWGENHPGDNQHVGSDSVHADCGRYFAADI